MPAQLLRLRGSHDRAAVLSAFPCHPRFPCGNGKTRQPSNRLADVQIVRCRSYSEAPWGERPDANEDCHAAGPTRASVPIAAVSGCSEIGRSIVDLTRLSISA